MQEFAKIKFTSPRDIKKGEQFTLSEIFSIEKNLSGYNKLIENTVSNEVERREAELQKNIKIKYEEMFNSQKDKLEKIYEENKFQLNKLFDEKESNIRLQVNNEFQAKELEFNKKLSKLESSEEKYKEINQQLNFLLKEKQTIFDSLKQKYTELLEEKLNILRKEHNNEKEKLIKQYEDAKKSATTIGANAEQDVFDKLNKYFQTDIITKPNHKEGGADILQKIVENDKKIAKIYYEIKNRKTWARKDYENFADKVRKEKYEFNIFISFSLPKSSKEQHMKAFGDNFLYDEINNIYLVSFDNWLPIVVTIRNQAISLYNLNDQKQHQTDIKQKIFEFFNSATFNNYFSRIKKNINQTNRFFDDIQTSTLNGKSEINKMYIEIGNLEMDIDSKLRS